MRRQKETDGRERRRRTREQKTKLVERWCESGLSRAEFCRQEGICYGSFLGWIAQWVEESAEAPEFVEVIEEPLAVRSPGEDSAIEMVAPNGWRVRMRGGVEIQNVERIVEVLSRC